MALRLVNDPALLAQLNGVHDQTPSGPAGLKPVSDPALLAQLNASEATPEAPAPSVAAQAGRGLALSARSLLEGANGLPQMAEDAGVGLRNVAEGAVNKYLPAVAKKIYGVNDWIARHVPAGAENVVSSILPTSPGNGYASASEQNRQALNSVGVPEPKGFAEKAMSIGLSGLGGSFVPAPQSAEMIPSNLKAPANGLRGLGQMLSGNVDQSVTDTFVPPAKSLMQQTLRDGQGLGYVAPPSMVNPTLANQVAEGAAGKASVAQAMASHNQDVTNAIAKKALGLPEDAAITVDALKGIRSAAGKVYEQVAKAGEIRPDAQYLDDLSQLGQSAATIAKDFPDADVAASGKINDLVDSMLRDKFDARSALEYLKELRSQASTNLSFQASADPAKRALGMAQKEAAASLEDLITRHLATQGNADLATAFDNARRTIAKTYSVQSALNESTGNIVASALGGQLKKGKPLSGDLELAARFARTFPKATREVTESFPGLSPWDFGWGGVGSMVTGTPIPWLYPFARIGLRHALMSPAAQKAAAGYGMGSVPPALVMGSAGAAN